LRYSASGPAGLLQNSAFVLLGVAVSAWLDVLAGLTLIYLGLSLFVTVIQEGLSHALGWRNRHLRWSLEQLLGDPQLLALVRGHPLYWGTHGAWATQGVRSTRPVYVNPQALAGYLIGALGQEGSAAPLARFTEGVESLGTERVRREWQTVLALGAGDLGTTRLALADWLGQGLEVLGQSYRERARRVALVLGIGLAVAVNVDTVMLVDHLYRDKEAREDIAALAEHSAPLQAAPGSPIALQAPLLGEAVASRLALSARIPLGWAAGDSLFAADWRAVAVRLLGWLLTGYALSLGAPFWFDVLGRVMRIGGVAGKTQG